MNIKYELFFSRCPDLLFFLCSKIFRFLFDQRSIYILFSQALFEISSNYKYL